MTGGLLDHVRRLDRAERRWLADARDRLRRPRATIATTAPAAAPDEETTR